MLNFYAFPEAARVVLCMLTVICAAVAALVFILRQYRLKQSTSDRIDSALSILVICQSVINIALVARVQHNIIDGFVVQNGYVTLRYMLFAAITTATAILLLTPTSFPRPQTADHCPLSTESTPNSTLQTPNSSLPASYRADTQVRPYHQIPARAPRLLFPIPYSLIPIISSILTLPIVETWTGGAFPVFFTAALLLLLAGGVNLTVKIRGELTTNISGLSIKQAMDSLNTAVLFYRENGRILIQNNKMRELMIKTAGHVIDNGGLYLEKVVVPGAEHNDANSYLIRVEDSAWLFSVGKILIRGRPVTRLTANDVTGLDNGNMLLQEKNSELKEQEKQLRDFVGNIEEISRSEELLHIKAETHDSIGQKLTLLLRYLHQGNLPEENSLLSILEDLRVDLQKIGTMPDDPQAELDALIDSYGSVDVSIDISGQLPRGNSPGDKSLSSVLVKVLREAAANAVIHGRADRIYVNISADKQSTVMQVTDNSPLPPKEIIEGGGIAGMKQRLAKIGGTLHIAPSPRFTLTATVTSEKDI